MSNVDTKGKSLKTFFASKKGKVITAITALALTGSLVAVGAVVYTTNTHNVAVANAQSAVEKLGTAELVNLSAERNLEYRINNAVDLNIKVSYIINEATDAGVDAKLLEELVKVQDEFTSLLTGYFTAPVSEDVDADTASETEEAVVVLDSAVDADVETFVTPKVDRKVDVDASNESLDALSGKVNAATVKVAKSTDAIVAESKTVSDGVADIIAAVTVLAGNSKAISDKAATDFPSADQASKDAVNAAVVTLIGEADENSEGDTAVTVVSTNPANDVDAFVKAVLAMKNSHVAVETQKAIDAANAANSPEYTDPDTGEQRANPNYTPPGGGGGGGGGGGYTPPGDGGYTPPGDGGGGGGGSSWAPLMVSQTGANCVNGQGASVTYGSTIVIPAAATSYTTYEISGYGWGATWYCNIGF